MDIAKWIEDMYAEWEQELSEPHGWGYWSNSWWGGSDDFKNFLLKKIRLHETDETPKDWRNNKDDKVVLDYVGCTR